MLQQAPPPQTIDTLQHGRATDALQEPAPADPYAETWAHSEIPTAPPDRLEQFMVQQDKLFVVVAVVLVIWIGIAIFLFRTDRRLARIAERLDEEGQRSAGT